MIECDEWAFWRKQLAGEEPETTPGTPWAGYYLSRRRSAVKDVQLGKRRHKVTTTMVPVAIWFEDGWKCLIGDYLETDVEAIDNIFSRCCRQAISQFEYEEARNADQ